MNIYLIRHGDAVKASLKIKDFDRELSEEGKNLTKIAAGFWQNLIPSFDFIVTSPLLRAKQTAQVIAERYKIEDNVLIDKRLSPGSETQSLVDISRELGVEELAFVGHQPDFSEHLSNLISSTGINVSFTKGAIAKINFQNKARLSNGTLEFLIPPGVFK